MSEAKHADRTEPLRRFKRYPAYKESGVEWLGEIPVHWEVKPNATLFSERDERGREDLPILEVSIASGVRVREFSASKIEQRSDDLGAYKVARRGDIAFNKMRMWQGAVGTTPEDGLVSPDYIVARPRTGTKPQYYAPLFRTGSYMAEVYRWSHGIVDDRNRLYWDDFKAIRSPFPPTEEQRAIAAFLDRETARVDALVAKKERLIELLQEQRTALITRAVTKGLDPNVPMKDSGVEWLGEIPAHWEAARMWRISEATSGGTPAKEERGYWDGDIPWVSPKDMKRRFIDSSEDAITERAVRETGIKVIAPPVVLIVVRGMILAHTFPVAITTVPVTINQDMKALRFRQRVDPIFAAWLFEGVGRGILGAVVEEAAHGTRAIRMDRWRAVVAPVLPIDEQRAIAAFLDRETARIDALVAKVREAIERLKELRTGLISAAVTGKIDVREAVAG